MRSRCLGVLLFIFVVGISHSSERQDFQRHVISNSSVTLGFDDFFVDVFDGVTMLPDEYKEESNGVWRDSFGKRIDPPHVNFAGKYFLSLHSCGAGCRYYTLTNLVDGKMNRSIEMFESGDPPPLTREGYPYMTTLFYRKNSAMLVAQYQIQTPEELICRERIFMFDEEQIKAITGTRYYCNSWNIEADEGAE
jgi:hypothetical protein